MDVCPHSFPDELQSPLVLRDLAWLHGVLLIAGKAAHLSHYVPQEHGVLGEKPTAAAVLWLAHVLGHFVILLRPMAMG